MLTNPESSGLGSGSQGRERALLTYTEFEQLRDRTEVFSSLMACESQLDRVQAGIDSSQSEELRFRMVSNEYFQTLGVPALVGRTLQPTDELRSPYVVISYEFWQRRFGGRVEALERKITIHKGIFTVIGVMPASFFGETVGEQPDLWLPLGMQPTILTGRDYLHDKPQDPSKDMWLHVFGRLKPGITIQKAQAVANFVFKQELRSFYASRLSAEKAKGFMNQRLTLRPAATGASQLRTQVAGSLELAPCCLGTRAPNRLRKPGQPATGSSYRKNTRVSCQVSPRSKPSATCPAGRHRESGHCRIGRLRKFVCSVGTSDGTAALVL